MSNLINPKLSLNVVGHFTTGPGEEAIDPLNTMEDAHLGHAYMYGKNNELTAPQTSGTGSTKEQ